MIAQLLVLADPIPSTVITTGGQIIIAMIGLVLAPLAEASRREAKRGRLAAQQAARSTSATGNGYAGRTEQALSRIEDQLIAVREDQRQTSKRLDHYATRLDRHLDDGQATT